MLSHKVSVCEYQLWEGVSFVTKDKSFSCFLRGLWFRVLNNIYFMETLVNCLCVARIPYFSGPVSVACLVCTRN